MGWEDEDWDDEEEVTQQTETVAKEELSWKDEDEIEDEGDEEEAKPYEKMSVDELVQRCKARDKELDRLREQLKELKKKGGSAAADQQEEERELTPMEKLALKMKQQKQSEEQDMLLACDTFGVDASEVKLDAVNEDLADVGFADKFKPANKADFEQFAGAIVAKVAPYAGAREFPYFVTELAKAMCDGLSLDDTRRVASALSLVANEKQKASKGKVKPKKASKKATLGGGGMKAKIADAFEGMQASAALDNFDFDDDAFM